MILREITACSVPSLLPKKNCTLDRERDWWLGTISYTQTRSQPVSGPCQCPFNFLHSLHVLELFAAKMGVDVETIEPGKGTNFFTLGDKNGTILIHYFSSKGQDYPKKGQQVSVHYTGLKVYLVCRCCSCTKFSSLQIRFGSTNVILFW